MEKNKTISHSAGKDEISAREGRKEWMKKLEAISGRPLEVSKRQSVVNTELGIVYLVIDCSVSMKGDKLKQAKQGASSFAEEAQGKGYAVGLIKFGTKAEPVLEPQRELSKFASYIESLNANGSTNMAEGIQIATGELIRRNGEKIICLVTDGQPDDKMATLKIAGEAKNAGIEIMTIGTDDADESFLAELATRKELSVKVPSKQLQQAIASMARLLPSKT